MEKSSYKKDILGTGVGTRGIVQYQSSSYSNDEEGNTGHKAMLCYHVLLFWRMNNNNREKNGMPAINIKIEHDMNESNSHFNSMIHVKKKKATTTAVTVTVTVTVTATRPQSTYYGHDLHPHPLIRSECTT